MCLAGVMFEFRYTNIPISVQHALEVASEMTSNLEKWVYEMLSKKGSASIKGCTSASNKDFT